jgi:hypothetical protein
MYQLPPGPKQLDVDLDPGLIAITWDPGAVGEVLGALESARSERLETGASRLAILDLAGNGGQFEARVLRAASTGSPPRLSHGSQHEQVFPGPATLRLELDPRLAASPSAVLFVAGDDVTWK